MTCEHDEPMFSRLARLPALEPEPARSENVRIRCRAALVRSHEGEAAKSRRLATLVLESSLTYGFSVSYLFAMIDDLLRLYMRR